MTPEERQKRFLEVSAELAETERLQIVDLEREGELLEELDRIEYEVGNQMHDAVQICSLVR